MADSRFASAGNLLSARFFLMPSLEAIEVWIAPASAHMSDPVSSCCIVIFLSPSKFVAILIVLDLGLPDMDGREVCKHLRTNAHEMGNPNYLGIWLAQSCIVRLFQVLSTQTAIRCASVRFM